MNRINKKFKALKAKGKKAFVAFVTSGDPSLTKTKEIVLGLERAGVDILELGIPFSDPLADGPTIQLANERALRKHTNITRILALIKNLRQKSQIPIALMTSYNPVFTYGLSRFCRDCQKSGVDGIIVPDLPLEEAKDLRQELKKKHISFIFFIAPTSSAKKKRETTKAVNGFIYYLSLTGVTGARKKLSPHLIKDLVETRKITKNKPLCVGFGISSPKHIKQLKPYCDGVIVGSAIVHVIEKNIGKKDLAGKVERFTKKLVEATHL